MKRLFYVICLGFLGLSLSACENGDADNENEGNDGSILSETVVDEDGNVYHAVKIGSQIWMLENLRTTKYNDGTDIPHISTAEAWNYLVSTPAYCWYNQDSTTYSQKFGALYNWYAVNTGKLAPDGWHVPTVADWNELSEYVSTHVGTSGALAKALASKTDWIESTTDGYIGYNPSINNSMGFTGFPGGVHGNRASDGLGQSGNWWSTDESGNFGQYASLRNHVNNRLWIDTYIKYYGLSVRCIKDR